MFCDGKCKIEKETEDGLAIKKCGLFVELIMENKLTNKTENVEMCLIQAIYYSMLRQEQGQIRIQVATESTRNEYAEQMRMARDTIAKGFLGLIMEAENRNSFLREVGESEVKKFLKDNSFVGNEMGGIHEKNKFD